MYVPMSVVQISDEEPSTELELNMIKGFGSSSETDKSTRQPYKRKVNVNLYKDIISAETSASESRASDVY